jgi:group I intron endonuclease
LDKKNTHFNPKLKNAWNKYGESCFVFEILEVSNRDRIRTLESDYIQKFDSVDSGYNISYDTIAPMTGRKQTEHSIKRIHEDVPAFPGEHHSDN